MSAQSMEALAGANEARFARAQLRARIEACGSLEGRRLVADLLERERTAPLLRGLPVWKLLDWPTRARAEVILERADVPRLRRSLLVRIGDLTDNEVRELCSELRRLRPEEARRVA